MFDISTNISQSIGVSSKEQFYPLGENYCLTVHMAGPIDTVELFHDKLSQKANISGSNCSILENATEADLKKATSRILNRITKEKEPVGAFFITLQGHSSGAPGVVQPDGYTGCFVDADGKLFQIREIIKYIRIQLTAKKKGSNRTIEIPIVLIIAVSIKS